MKVAVHWALAVAIVGLIVASPLPTATIAVRDAASTLGMVPTAKPTLPAVAVLADEDPWTYTVFNVYWPQEHIDSRKPWYAARAGVLAMWICLILGLPIALIAWAVAIGYCFISFEKWNSRRRVRAVYTNKSNTLDNWRNRQAAEVDQGANDSPGVETHELDTVQRIKFSDADTPHGDENATPILPNPVPANAASVDTLPSYHSSDPRAGTGRRRGGIRGALVGATLLFSRRANGAPLPDSLQSLSIADNAVAEPLDLAPAIARAAGIVAFAAESTATVASAVHARDIPPDVTLTAPKTEETKCRYKGCRLVDSASEVLVWTTYTGPDPVTTVIVATSATVGGNIVPYGGWLMEKTAKKEAYLRIQEYVLIPLVYGPAAIGVLVYFSWKMIQCFNQMSRWQV